MDLEGKKRCLQIDGLRGIAILLVILSHNNILNQGGVSNAIFFTISGFLFINPFAEDYERKFLSPKNILRFYGNRALRLLPTYYIVLLFVYILTGYRIIPKILWIPNLYFTNFYEHLWYIHALVRTLLIAPVIMTVFIRISDRVKPLQNDLVRSLVFIIAATVVRLSYIRLSIPFDNRLYQFMVGISVAYMFRFIRKDKKLYKAISDMSLLGNTIITSLFLMIVLSSGDVINMLDHEKYILVGWQFPLLTALFSGVLLLCIALYDRSFYAKILSSKPLLFFSRLSLPLYLINSFVLFLYDGIKSDILRFICVLATTVALSWPLDLILNKAIKVISSRARKTS